MSLSNCSHPTPSQSARKELLKVQVELRELRASRSKTEETLSSTQKQLGEKQLVRDGILVTLTPDVCILVLVGCYHVTAKGQVID